MNSFTYCEFNYHKSIGIVIIIIRGFYKYLLVFNSGLTQ